jgi:ABC-type glycerol-3-phosphate transport system permease component
VDVNVLKKPKVNIGKRMRMLQRILGYSVLSLLAFAAMTPLIWLLDISFRPKVEIFNVPPAMFTRGFFGSFSSYTLASFTTAFERFQIHVGFLNSAFIVVLGIFLTLLIGSLCSFAFAFLKFPGRNVMFICILATMMLPTGTMIAPFYQVLRTLGLTNSLFGIIIPYASGAWTVFMMRQYFVRLPYSFIEAGIVDGAGFYRVWWQIILPLAKPALAAMAILQFRGIWNDFLMPMIVLRDEKLFTLPIKLQVMASMNYEVPYDAMMATSFVTAIIPVVFFIIFQRYFVEGIAGGMKG